VLIAARKSADAIFRLAEILVSRSFRGPATGAAVVSVHDVLDDLWQDVPFVQDMDQIAFTTAVIESASNVVQHAKPSGPDPVELGVVIIVQHRLLEARVSAYNSTLLLEPTEPMMPDQDAESGRGLALIQALVTTAAFEHKNSTNTWILSRRTSQTS
jgi:serine/threonine-protein kinase RsbW